MRSIILCGLLGAAALGGVVAEPMMVGDPTFEQQPVDPEHADQCGWSPPPVEAIHEAEDETLSTKAPELFQ